MTSVPQPKHHVAASWITMLGACIAAAGLVFTSAAKAAEDKEPLKSLLMESMSKSRGITVHAAGATIALVVTSIEPCCVIGRNAQSSRIVVRLDRIDAAIASF